LLQTTEKYALITHKFTAFLMQVTVVTYCFYKCIIISLNPIVFLPKIHFDRLDQSRKAFLMSLDFTLWRQTKFMWSSKSNILACRNA